MTDQLVLPLEAEENDVARAGGKASALSRLLRAGFSVPRGFVVTTAAFRAASTDREAVHRAIREAFRARALGVVAVRSSATAEDGGRTSFAGQHETVLGVQSEAELRDAVERCWRSASSERAMAYRQARAVEAPIEMAVLVQELVPAEIAGVMFTTDPQGDEGRMAIDAVLGLGEALVSGHATPDHYVVDRATMGVVEARVPEERRDEPVLREPLPTELAQIGLAIEGLFGHPVDVEWARHQSKWYVLQARPITATRPRRETWNDSLSGDFLWSTGNLGEAVPDVMTPCTWSAVERFMADTMATSTLGPMRAFGNIGGRFYMNLSVAASLAAAFGMKEKFSRASTDVFGRIPEGVEVPLVPMSRWTIYRLLLPVIVRVVRRTRQNRARLSMFLSEAPARAAALRQRASTTADRVVLATLFRDEIEPFARECARMLEAGARDSGDSLVGVREELITRVGRAAAETMLTGIEADAHGLASLGPSLGLSRVARGEMDRAAFVESYGHRSAHEFELSIPRPAEDPRWLDEQIEKIGNGGTDVVDLLRKREEERERAWRDFAARSPREARTLRGKVAQWGQVVRSREAARSEVMRAFWVMRAFALRAGELLGIGADVFMLSLDETLDWLEGRADHQALIGPRRATFDHYVSLPRIPDIIRGRLDIERWAADPSRRTDLYVEGRDVAAPSAVIAGFAGSEGIVEGSVRVLSSPEEADSFVAGEILVARVTNIGWTPLFPRALAVVTDVGAPLSHATIVARELGIPAVVGCGNATALLRTGDHVRVDGGRGVVEKLERAADATGAASRFSP